MNVYQHFRPEEHSFIDQVLSWKQQVEESYAPKLTDFLDPREQHIVRLLVGSNESTKVYFFGGANDLERQRAVLYPDYYQPEEQDLRISLLEILYPVKFVTIEHRQVLGSFMSLGLKRSKFGDILTAEDRVQIFVASEVAPYIENELQSIGRAKVRVKVQPLSEAITQREKWLELSTTVSSLRLDAIVAAAHNLSRQKAQNLITHGLVKVNWTTIENTSFECVEGDMVSARGYGRAKIDTIDGQTKREKWRIIIKKHN